MTNHTDRLDEIADAISYHKRRIAAVRDLEAELRTADLLEDTRLASLVDEYHDAADGDYVRVYLDLDGETFEVAGYWIDTEFLFDTTAHDHDAHLDVEVGQPVKPQLGAALGTIRQSDHYQLDRLREDRSHHRMCANSGGE